jgi:site-specific recombinase XerD
MENAPMPDISSQQPPVAPPLGLDLFERWLDERSRDPYNPLSEGAAKPYRYIWASWLHWLAGETMSWNEAGPTEIMRFLEQGVVIAATNRRSPNDPISEITRRRYWRLLQQVYQHALESGLIENNPVRPAPDVKPPPPEASGGLALKGPQWHAVISALPLPNSRWDIRDRAILQLLIDAALTTGEVAKLRLDQVEVQVSPMVLRIAGERHAQGRELVLSKEAGEDLKRWLQERQALAEHKVLSNPDLVFVTNRGRGLGGRTLFALVSQTITRGLLRAGFELPQHIGPQVLRNSRIVEWAREGMPLEEVVRRAGFKDHRSLRGLREHLR